MEMKVIKSETDYQAALAGLGRLIDLDPDVGGEDADTLELLALLIEDYEAKQFPIGLPDPIDAIRFCMEQRGLTQKDLVPFIGSRGKVSEVLSRKRPLTLAMIRALHKGLGVPAGILVGEPGASLAEDADIDWQRFPLKDMIERGWIEASMPDARDRAEELITAFLEPVGGLRHSPVLYRKSYPIRAARKMNPYALEAWRARVLRRALDEHPSDHKPSLIDLEFMRDVARLSRAGKGPLLARDFLNGYGIILIVEPHLPKTYLDGAAFLTLSGNPVIAMTLRYDRIDNFWFVLMHELAHVSKHLSKESPLFFDDLDPVAEVEPIEREADDLATEALIPHDKWRASDAFHLRTAHAAEALAEDLRIHPAIVAGKIRHETRNYRKLNRMVGHGQVRRLFEI